jgi:uncharacterized protein YdbL (DUF1318 family)
MSTRSLLVFAAIATIVIVACLTVNVYFYPSEEVDQTAKQIIEDIRGGALPENEQEETEKEEGASETELEWWHLTAVAYAAGEETKVSNPAILSLKQKIKERFNDLKPYFKAGAIGEGNDGLVAIRDASVLPMKDRATLNRIVKEENKDRKALYKEVAKELGVEGKDLPKVQKSFAEKWQEFARSGWWIQDEAGNWNKR